MQRGQCHDGRHVHEDPDQDGARGGRRRARAAPRHGGARRHDIAGKGAAAAGGGRVAHGVRGVGRPSAAHLLPPHQALLAWRDGQVRLNYPAGAIETIKSKYQEKSTSSRAIPPPLKDHHALPDWKMPSVLFNFMHMPKEIVQTYPREKQERYLQPVDLLRKEVQMTRPSLLITPSVSSDDNEDSVRKVMTDDMYSTILAKMAREAGGGMRSPLPGMEAPAGTMSLAKVQPPRPRVAGEWRMACAAWDGRQLHTYCPLSRRFWLGGTVKCEACTVTAEHGAKEKMMRLPKQRKQ